MPVDIIHNAVVNGPEIIPGWPYIKAYGPAVLGLAAIKYYFRGSMNTWERDMHGKVYIVTGGTSGLGSELVKELATRGAQIILLVRTIEDNWLEEYVDDLRETTNNFMIYAEQCDLNSLYSVRKFATKWLDNQPPRRLDGILCCAAECLPVGKTRQVTEEGVERQIGINYLAHYHLITLLAPALRVQPGDRDVRSLGEVDLEDLLFENKRYNKNKPYLWYGTSKLLMGLFAKEFQKRCDEYERKDKLPCNIKINLVNPGMMRSPSTRRFLSMGTIWGLLLYVLLFPIWYIFFKHPYEGQQSFLFALWAPFLAKMDGGQMISECKVIRPSRKEFKDTELQAAIFDQTEELITKLEKQSAIERKKQEKKNESKKPKEQRLQEAKEKHLAQLKKKQDIHEIPASVEELDSKLGYLRQSIQPDMPLFPESVPGSSTSSKKKKSKAKK
ncbi:hypothetical protein PSN45_004186 [Yamadazyma tenuis]|uniref:uncharacterized protein n=1 Tax=Candida tenuis TaxID=2315449 RepID=UPI0027A10CD6|nr:hypothetical protein PSN45_004186 [Yamadazyma tenuis]